MSSHNIELVRRYYDDWNRGDVDAAASAFAPDVEWHGHPVAATLDAAFEKLRGLQSGGESG